MEEAHDAVGRTYLVFGAVAKLPDEFTADVPRPGIEPKVEHRRVDGLFEQPGDERELGLVPAVQLRVAERRLVEMARENRRGSGF